MMAKGGLRYSPKYMSQSTFPWLCSIGYVQKRTRGIYLAIYHTRHGCGLCMRFIEIPDTEFCATSIQKPYTCVSSTFYTVPDTFVRSIPHPHNTRYFCGFCKKFMSAPDTFVSSERLPYNTRSSCEFCTPLVQNLGYGYTFVEISGVQVQVRVLPGDGGVGYVTPSDVMSRHPHKIQHEHNHRSHL